MKKLIAVAVIVIAIWLYLNRQEEGPDSRPATAAAPTAATTTPTPIPTATPLATPAPQGTPDNRMARMAALAKDAGLQFRGFRPEAGGGWVTVAWRSDVATEGADYVATLIREGVVRDLDPAKKTLNPQMVGGRRVWVGSFYVMF